MKALYSTNWRICKLSCATHGEHFPLTDPYLDAYVLSQSALDSRSANPKIFCVLQKLDLYFNEILFVIFSGDPALRTHLPFFILTMKIKSSAREILKLLIVKMQITSK
jgi:hypothetical protein